MRDEFPKPSILLVFETLGGQPPASTRSGWQKVKCILHDDSNASASLNEDACRYHCFVCDFSGDAVDLIERVEGAGIAAARRKAEELAGDSDRNVRGGSGQSGLLPRRTGHRPGRRSPAPPWTRFGGASRP